LTEVVSLGNGLLSGACSIRILSSLNVVLLEVLGNRLNFGVKKMGRNNIITAKIKNKIYNITITTLCLLVLVNLLMLFGCQEQTSTEGHPATSEGRKLSSPPKSENVQTGAEAPVIREKVGVTSTQAVAKEPKAEKPAPKIKFEAVDFDFGEVGTDTSNTGEFKFTNIGDAPLNITKVERCCGTIVKLSKNEFKPDESGVLTVRYNAPPRPGMMRRKLYVNSNDKDSPRLMLNIRAKVVQRVDYEPKRLTISLKGQEPNVPEITIVSLDGRPFSITAIDSTNDCIMADYDVSVEATKFVLQPKVNLEKFHENTQGHINIRLSHPECKKVTIFFEGLSRFKITPPQIMVFNADPDKPINRTVWVLSNYDEDFEIELVSSRNNTVKVLEQKKVSKGYQLDLQITPPAQQENKSLFTDELLINIKGGGKLAITCRCFYSRK
jgi:hypothetical protein